MAKINPNELDEHFDEISIEERIKKKMKEKRKKIDKENKVRLERFIDDYASHYYSGGFSRSNEYLTKDVIKFCEERNIYWERGKDREYGEENARFIICNSKEEVEKLKKKARTKQIIEKVCLAAVIMGLLSLVMSLI